MERTIGIPDDHVRHDDEMFGAGEVPHLWHRARWKKIIAQVHSRYRGKGVRIGILDTGSPVNHEFIDESNVVIRRDFTGESRQADDNNGHGGHVHGIIAGLEGLGLAPEAEICVYKVLGGRGSGSTRGINEAIVTAAEDGCHFINASLGSAPGAERREDQQAVSRAYTEGLNLAVVAAGNAGRAGRNRTTIGPPGSLDGSFTVGSTSNNDDELSNFSSTGPQINAVSPGDRIISVDSRSPSGLVGMSGTSMATPNLCGGLALIQQHRRSVGLPDLVGVEEWTVFFAENAMLIDLNRPGFDNETGHGILSMENVFRYLIDQEPDWSWASE